MAAAVDVLGRPRRPLLGTESRGLRHHPPLCFPALSPARLCGLPQEALSPRGLVSTRPFQKVCFQIRPGLCRPTRRLSFPWRCGELSSCLWKSRSAWLGPLPLVPRGSEPPAPGCTWVLGGWSRCLQFAVSGAAFPPGRGDRSSVCRGHWCLLLAPALGVSEPAAWDVLPPGSSAAA